MHAYQTPRRLSNFFPNLQKVFYKKHMQKLRIKYLQRINIATVSFIFWSQFLPNFVFFIYSVVVKQGGHGQQCVLTPYAWWHDLWHALLGFHLLKKVNIGKISQSITDRPTDWWADPLLQMQGHVCKYILAILRSSLSCTTFPPKNAPT